LSKVIKAGSSQPISEAPLFDARLEAHTILDEARAEAERIRAEAHRDAERLRQQAVAEGRERGLQAVTELLAGARLAAARVQQAAEADLRALAVRIAEKILDRELALRPDAVVDIAVAALRFAGEPREISMRVHPDDLAAIERGKPRLVERCLAAQAVAFRPDPAIGRGGCVIETELGVVDARLSTQLEAIERALRGESG